MGSKAPHPEVGNYPTCDPCRRLNHESCRGCTGCGCIPSARWSHHMSDPNNRAQAT